MSTFDRAKMNSLVGCLAHEKKLLDGAYGIDPQKTKTAEAVQKVVSILIIKSFLS